MQKNLMFLGKSCYVLNRINYSLRVLRSGSNKQNSGIIDELGHGLHIDTVITGQWGFHDIHFKVMTGFIKSWVNRNWNNDFIASMPRTILFTPLSSRFNCHENRLCPSTGHTATGTLSSLQKIDHHRDNFIFKLLKTWEG